MQQTQEYFPIAYRKGGKLLLKSFSEKTYINLDECIKKAFYFNKLNIVKTIIENGYDNFDFLLNNCYVREDKLNIGIFSYIIKVFIKELIEYTQMSKDREYKVKYDKFIGVDVWMFSLSDLMERKSIKKIYRKQEKIYYNRTHLFNFFRIEIPDDIKSIIYAFIKN